MRKIAVIVGSIRRESINKKLARALARLADGKLLFDTVKIDDLPLFNQDEELNPTPAVLRLKQQIRGCDGVLFVTPEHNRSIPAALKTPSIGRRALPRTALSRERWAPSSALRVAGFRRRSRSPISAPSPDVSYGR